MLLIRVGVVVDAGCCCFVRPVDVGCLLYWEESSGGGWRVGEKARSVHLIGDRFTIDCSVSFVVEGGAP